MSVSTTTNRSDQLGDGATAAFAFTFPVYTKSDLKVYVNDTLKTITTHYTQTAANLAGGASGGTVTFTFGNIPALNDTVILIRDMTVSQAVSFSNLDRADAKSAIEGTFDKDRMIDQQLQEQLNRSLHFPLGATAASSLIPDPRTTSNQGLALILTATGIVAAAITGTAVGFPVSVLNGGTGVTTLTSTGVLIGHGTGAVTTVVGNDNQVLQGAGTSANPRFTADAVVSSITATTATVLGAGTVNNLFVSTAASMNALKVSATATIGSLIATTGSITNLTVAATATISSLVVTTLSTINALFVSTDTTLSGTVTITTSASVIGAIIANRISVSATATINSLIVVATATMTSLLASIIHVSGAMTTDNTIRFTAATPNSFVVFDANKDIFGVTPTDRQILVGTTGASPVATSLIAGVGVTFTSTSGTLTVATNGGWVLLASATAAVATSVEFISAINSTYDDYFLECINPQPTSATADMWLRMSTNGGTSYDATAVGYAHNRHVGFDATGVDAGATGDSKIVLGLTPSSLGGAVSIHLFAPASAKRKIIQFFASYVSIANNMVCGPGAGVYQATTSAVNAVQFLYSNGTVASGTFYLYGVKKT